VSRLLLDANVSPALAEALRWRGHDAVHVNELGLRHAPDAVIFTTAGATRRAVVTHDNDFLRLLAAAPGGPAVIHLSQRELHTDPVVGRLAHAIRLSEVLHELGDRIGPGLAVKVSSVTLRIDREPRARQQEPRARQREPRARPQPGEHGAARARGRGR
jgi:predicted nuclease of predicted toxin-antitoxin system